MKKIGIITYHQAHNYGAVLQCYALQEVLNSLDYETKVINYHPAFRDGFFNILAYKGVYKALQFLKYRLLHRSCKVEASVFAAFCRKFLTCTKTYRKGKIPQGFDTYVLGSDQLWRTNFRGTYIDTVYFGDFYHSAESKICGYAISGDLKSINSIDPNKLLQYTNNFDSLSFREESLGALVNKITGAEYRVDIDPILLADASIYDKLISDIHHLSDERYVLLYNLRGDHSIFQAKAEALATRLDCKVINLREKIYTPNEFVMLFKHATYIITSSFHGTAFSLKFERPFYAIKLNDGHDARYVDLLNSIGVEKALVDLNTELIPTDIDYNLVREVFNQKRECSINYLKQI